MSNKTILRRPSQATITCVFDIDRILKMKSEEEINQLEEGQPGYKLNVVKREPKRNEARKSSAPKYEGYASVKTRTTRSEIPRLRNNKTENAEGTTENKKNTTASPKLDATFTNNDKLKMGRITKRKLDMSGKGFTNEVGNSRKTVTRRSKTSGETAKPIGKQPIRKNNVAAAPAAVVKGTSATKVKTEKKADDQNEISSKAKNTSQRGNLQSRASTQKKNVSENSSSEEKKRVAKNPATKNSKNYSISTRGAVSKRPTSGELSSAKNLNNNKDTVRFAEKNNVPVDETKDMKDKLAELKPKTEEVRVPPRSTLSPIVEKHSHDSKEYSKHEMKNATVVKDVGRFEKQLLERKERQRKKKMERCERKMGRVVNKFSQQVLKIMKQIDRSQENESSLDSDSSFSSSCGESSYSTSSSWFSCSCTLSSCDHSKSYDTDDYSGDSSCSCSCCSHSES